MRRGSSQDFLDVLSGFMARNKGLPVLLGIALAVASLVLACLPALVLAAGFWGWVARSHVLLHIGVIVGLAGILVGDAL